MLVLSAGGLFSYPLYRDAFSTYYNREVIRLHTLDVKELAGRLAGRFSYLLEIEDMITLQRELNDNFGTFGLVITDCPVPNGPCPSERVLFTSSPSLPWKRMPSPEDLSRTASVPLYGAIPLTSPHLVSQGVDSSHDPSRAPGEPSVLGRLYLFNNLPSDVPEDFSIWLKHPFRDTGPHRIYLKITLGHLILSTLFWLSIELLLANRRLQLEIAQRRSDELRMTADAYLKQLEEKDSLISELENYALEQFETYSEKIRVLERRVREGSEFESIAEELITDLEQEKMRQSERYAIELSRVHHEMEELQKKLVEYEQASEARKREMDQEMEQSFRPIFTNPFEKKVFETVAHAPRAEAGEWNVIPNFNVAVGKNFGQFVDALVITPSAVIVVEAKRYPGLITADGDTENTRWYYHNPSRREIRCMWGLNPYHQINQYCMSVLTLINTRCRQKLPVFGILVFPDTADLSPLGSLGAFYRATRVRELVDTVIELEEQGKRSIPSKGKRLTAEEIESILTGRNLRKTA
ncbi:MAG: hypothetical protein Fur0034_05300 [Desulfuromonadia bacterium]